MGALPGSLHQTHTPFLNCYEYWLLIIHNCHSLHSFQRIADGSCIFLQVISLQLRSGSDWWKWGTKGWPLTSKERVIINFVVWSCGSGQDQPVWGITSLLSSFLFPILLVISLLRSFFWRAFFQSTLHSRTTVLGFDSKSVQAYDSEFAHIFNLFCPDKLNNAISL